MGTVSDTASVEFSDGVLTFSGDLTAATIGPLERETKRIGANRISIVDGARIAAMALVGAVFVNGLCCEGAKVRGFPDTTARLLSLAAETCEAVEPVPAPPRMDLERFGGLILREIDRINDIAILTVDILWWSIHDIFDRSAYRKDSYTEQAFQMGSTALPIVVTILFLVGAVTTLQSTSTFRAFGASVFIADMIAIGFARELAPLLTAIIISGRSGSAIASEIATMKFTEELDALKTMGLNPIRFTVVPKLWAMVTTMPLLTIMALGAGILGGFVVAVTYIGMAPNTFIDRVVITLMFWDVTTGLIKSVSFAIIITIVGTYRGLTFTGGADGVGRATTNAVVTAIFTIIIMDSIWGILFYMKW